MSEKEDALYLQNEFNNMKAANYFETANGVIYFEPQGTKIVFGGATNAGIIPEYEFDYDFTQSLDWNLQGMIEQVFEAEGYPEFDEAKILNKRSNKMLKRNEAEEDIELLEDAELEVEEAPEENSEEVTGDSTTVNVEPGDKVVITLSAAESKLLNEVKAIKAGKFGKKNEAEDELMAEIENTLALEVPAVDGTVATIEIPEDADAEELEDVSLTVGEDVVADIMTLVGAE